MDGENLNERRVRKLKFRERMEKYMDEFKSVLVINVDNVGSNQLQQARMASAAKPSSSWARTP